MAASVLGIHHVTAICGDAQRNVDFYTGVLGLRLVKLTVNFDDPTAYHLYYGDGVGSPGTILTFFPYPDGRRATPGNEAFASVALAVPPGALPFWRERLGNVTAPGVGGPGSTLAFHDPDGMPLMLAESTRHGTAGTPMGGVPAERAIVGIHGVTLGSASDASGAFLQSALGLQPQGAGEYGVPGSGPLVDVRALDAAAVGGAGGIHHVALRVPDDAAQEEFRARLIAGGVAVSPVKDRNYFHSIYFREPGGALFEIATDNPGFAVDEPAESLGTTLRLPPQYEATRAEIERALPPLRLPGVTPGA